jgi:hypothetical protein
VPDFAVSYAHLEQVENTLNSLKGEFDGIDAVPHAADWGDSGIAQAMDSFASNWSYHRDKLMKSMDSMAKQAHGTRTGTAEYDSNMAQEAGK